MNDVLFTIVCFSIAGFVMFLFGAFLTYRDRRDTKQLQKEVAEQISKNPMPTFEELREKFPEIED